MDAELIKSDSKNKITPCRINVNITPQEISHSASEVQVINGYQASKFLKDYCSVFIDKQFRIFLTGGDPALFPEELEKILNLRQRNMQIVILPKLLFKADTKTISILERADKLIIPFCNKYKENYMLDNFLANIKKIKSKDKCLALLDINEYQTEEKLEKVLKIVKSLGFDNFIIGNAAVRSPTLKNVALKCRLHFQVFSPEFDINIETDGTVKSKSGKTSSIYKSFANFIF